MGPHRSQIRVSEVIVSPNELLAIRLVDFAHAFERNPGDVGPDENILFGLRNLIEFLQRLT